MTNQTKHTKGEKQLPAMKGYLPNLIMEDREKNITASIVGGGTFMFFLLVMHMFFPLSLAAGVATGVGLKYLLPGKKIKLPPGIMANDYKKNLSKGENILSALMEVSNELDSRDVRVKIDGVITISRKIISNIEDHPEDYRPAKKFFSYYLPTTKKLVDKYKVLQDDPAFEHKIKHALEMVADNFKKLYKKLKDDDRLEIDTELKVLKQAMESEL